MNKPLRRKVTSFLALVLLLILLVSCGSERRTTVRFWNGFTGPDGRTMLRIVKAFNEQNPDVHVMMQRMNWGTYYNKLFVAGMGERAPEIFIIHTDVLERFARANFVRPVDDLVEGANSLDTSDFDQNVWSAVMREGKHYAVPLDVHPLGMYYNRTRLMESGIVDEDGNPRPPRTREEFIDALKKMTKDTDGDGEIDQWGFVFTWLRTNIFTLMTQFGGKLFNEDYTVCTLNAPENVEALQFCVDLIFKHKVAPSPEDFGSWIGFRQGRVGLVWEGIYMLADLEKQTDMDYAGAPLPVVGSHPAAWAGSHNMCIRADLEGEQLDGTWRFIKFLSDNSLQWAKGGQVPVRKSLRASEQFQKMKVQSQFAKEIPYIQYMPKLPFVFEFYTEFDLAIEKAIRGSVSPQEALDTATKNVNEIIERYERNQREAENERAGGNP